MLCSVFAKWRSSVKPLVVACALSVGFLCLPSMSADKAKREFFSASAYDMADSKHRLKPVRITVQEYSSDEEIAQLKKAAGENGPEGLRKALQRMKPKGHIAIEFARLDGGELQWRVQLIRQATTERGRRIFLLTDSPVSTRERTDPAQMDEERRVFGLVILDVDPAGRGEGGAFVVPSDFLSRHRPEEFPATHPRFTLRNLAGGK